TDRLDLPGLPDARDRAGADSSARARCRADPGVATRTGATPGRGRDSLQGSLQGTEKGGKQPSACDAGPGPGSARGCPGGLLALVLACGLHELRISCG